MNDGNSHIRHAIHALAVDENRLERVAPNRVPLRNDRTLQSLLCVLYLSACVKSFGRAARWIPDWLWPGGVNTVDRVMITPMEASVCIACAVCFVAVWRKRRWAMKASVATLILRSATASLIVACEAHAAWQLGPRAGVEFIRACVTLPFELIAPLAILTLFVWRLTNRARDGLHCPSCGYNTYGLRSNRCPECGVVFGAESSTRPNEGITTSEDVERP